MVVQIKYQLQVFGVYFSCVHWMRQQYPIFFPPPEALAVGHTVTHARQVFDCFTVNSESIELCLRITFLIASTFSYSGHVTLLQHFWLWLSPLKWIIRANQVFFHPEVAAASLQSFFFFGLWSITLIDFFFWEMLQCSQSCNSKHCKPDLLETNKRHTHTHFRGLHP